MNAIVRAFFSDIEGYQLIPIGEGNINDTYRLTIAQKHYLLQRINKKVFKQPAEVQQNYERIYQHLFQQPIPLILPKLFKTKRGQSFTIDDAGDYWRMIQFIEQTHTFERADTITQVRSAVESICQFLLGLNQATVPNLHTTIPNFHNAFQRWKDFEQAIVNDTYNRKARVNQEITFVKEQETFVKSIAALHLPERLVHNDPKIGNVLFNAQQQAIVVIDWDTVMPGYLLFDFGDMIRTMASTADENEADLSKVKINENYYHTIYHTFSKILEQLMTTEEKTNLHSGGLYIVLEQAIRFLTDYLNGDCYYKIDYPLHNLVRARNQLHLFTELRYFLRRKYSFNC